MSARCGAPKCGRFIKAGDEYCARHVGGRFYTYEQVFGPPPQEWPSAPETEAPQDFVFHSPELAAYLRNAKPVKPKPHRRPRRWMHPFARTS